MMIPQSAIGWLSELEEFDAGHNYITQFPSFVSSPALTELCLKKKQYNDYSKRKYRRADFASFNYKIFACYVWQICRI